MALGVKPAKTMLLVSFFHGAQTFHIHETSSLLSFHLLNLH